MLRCCYSPPLTSRPAPRSCPLLDPTSPDTRLLYDVPPKSPASPPPPPPTSLPSSYVLSLPSPSRRPHPFFAAPAPLRSLLRPQRDRPPLPTLHPVPLRLSQPPSPIHHIPCHPHSRSRRLRRLRPPPHPSPPLRHLHRPLPPLPSQVPLPRRPRLLRPSPLHLRLHDREQGRLRRHLLEQVLDRRRPGHVLPPRDKPDGARDVRLPGVAAQR